MLRQNRSGGYFLHLLMLLLSFTPACGHIYTAPSIRNDETAHVAFVSVELTAGTVAQANATSYTPRPVSPSLYGQAPALGALGAPPPPRGDSEPYKLGQGDGILIQGKSLQLTTLEVSTQMNESRFQLRDDGTIDIPGVGVLALGGLTQAEADAALTELLKRERIDPTFRIEVVDYKARSVMVDGDVGSPGIVPITQTPLTMARALALRGGLQVTESSATIVHLYRDNQQYALRGDDILAMSDVILRDGDSLVADEARTAREDRELYTARLQASVEPHDQVYIMGEVTTPRMMPLPVGRQLALSELLLDQGGVRLEAGDLSQVYVLRSYARKRDIAVYHLDAANVVNLVLATQLQLRPNDIVFVSAQKVTNWARVFTQLRVGDVLAPFRVIQQ